MVDQRTSFRPFRRRPRFCQFCVDKVDVLDHKDVEILSRLIAGEGKIKPRRATGTCASHQRMVATAIKRARHMALLSYTSGIGGGPV